MGQRRYIGLDILRAIAANLVLIGHLRALLFVDFDAARTSDFEFMLKSFYFLTSLGHEAVIIFFVLSGFLVGGSVIKKNFIWRTYLLNRIVRLSIPLIPALLITVAIDIYIIETFPDLIHGAYYDLFSSGPSTNYSNSAWTFFGNILFLQTILVPVYGSNGPLWSLANEFWYYIIFPLFFIGFYNIQLKNRSLIFGLPLIAAALLLSLLLPIGLMNSFPIWLFGTIASFLYHGGSSKPKSTIALALVFFCLPLIITFKFSDTDILLGFVTSVAIYLLIRLDKGQQNFAQSHSNLKKLFSYLSDSSYTLYITHFPVMLLLYTVIRDTEQHQTLTSGIGIFAFYIITIHLATFIFYHCFERNTKDLRQLIGKWITGLSRQES